MSEVSGVRRGKEILRLKPQDDISRVILNFLGNKCYIKSNLGKIPFCQRQDTGCWTSLQVIPFRLILETTYSPITLFTYSLQAIVPDLHYKAHEKIA